MPTLIPHHSVVIHRDGKHVRPAIGKAFEFTAQEARELLDAHPTCLRRPIHEAPPVVELPEVTSAELAAEADDGDSADDTTRTPNLTPAQRKAAAARAAARKAAAEDNDEL